MQKRALMSVYDKTDLIPLAKQLIHLGYEIISTAGTSSMLEQAEIPVLRIEQLTGFPEMLSGRVKTLHPVIFGGILANRDEIEDIKTLSDHHIHFIDLVVVNLYPFKQAIVQGIKGHELIEMIDIGGVSLLRAAAKNHQHVTVITDPKDYMLLFNEVDIDLSIRKKLAGKVFSITSSYDAIIAEQFNLDNDIQFPDLLNLSYQKYDLLRYGENPHQPAAVYRHLFHPSTVLDAEILNGKSLSYNNIRDTEAALQILFEFMKPSVVVVKHMNPCAVSSKKTLIEAWHAAYQADPISIFGGIVATNQIIDLETARELHALFLEIIIAKGYEPEALQILKQKKNLRIMKYPDSVQSEEMECVSLGGGMLYQKKDNEKLEFSKFITVTKKKPTLDETNDLLFAMKTVRHVKSNAIVIAKDETTIGIGAGQMNRVGSAEIAFTQGKTKTQHAVLASDGFLPMTDTIELAHQFGISAIIQPGGSIADADVIALCNTYGISMVFSQSRHFKH